ncbi:UDP-N-acetylmuramate dehydrogenase [Candidatus Uhrbacteria bacterium]|nr:UDP-N-acetylmuramate dehydrogenase [Candidatus Uhrbacteria bacterium]
MVRDLKEKLREARENEPLAPYTTFKIGGPAKYFFVAKSADDMVATVSAALDCGVPFFVLAGGSNILVSDQGFDGLVILSAIKGLHTELKGGKAMVTAGAGENWDELVARATEQNWAGIECLSGIPGTVGAAPVQNIGAYGQSVGDVVHSVEAVDSRDGARITFDNAGCEFGYRASIFKKMKGRYIIVAVTIALAPNAPPLLAYHDLQECFKGKSPMLSEVRRAVIEIRARKGYVIMPEYECYKTAGSFFMNPIISDTEFQALRPKIKECPSPWYWELDDGRIKVSAACLLQSAGFSKGYRKGNVGISPKHSLSIVNFGGASAVDVVGLAEDIKKSVQEKFGINLKEEVQLVGFKKLDKSKIV